jgi:UDP-N-acetylmuramyl tripeptide synthase
MELLDSRRLTGPNVLWASPGAVIDVECSAEQSEDIQTIWQREVRRMLDAVGWTDESSCTRSVVGGVILAISAPVDALYAATEVTEWALGATEAVLAGDDRPALEPDGERIRAAIADEVSPALIALKKAATEAGIAFLSDDDHVSVGLGCGSVTWPVDALPRASEVAWGERHDIPIALVTGTNGKTTTVRLATAMAAAAGKVAAMTSTEGMTVGGELVDQGDYAGPGGARAVLRHQQAEIAVLETARGGLLRRGLGVTKAQAVAITTIAEDHLGDFGSGDLDELAAIKWILTRALEPQGRLILNAEEARLVAMAVDSPAPIIWCTPGPPTPLVTDHLKRGGEAFVVEDGQIVHRSGSERTTLCPVTAIPIAMGGAARHNVANALTAAALCHALGLTMEPIIQAMTSMTASDNPGRGNLFDLGGARVLIDFAHNPQAVTALGHLVRNLPARRRLLSFGQAGDRTDAQLRDFAQILWSFGPDHLHLADLAQYRRGRPEGEVIERLVEALSDSGARSDQISFYGSELESFEAALAWAEPGDLVVQLALADNTAILELIRRHGGKPVLSVAAFGGDPD